MPATSIFMSALSSGISGIGNSRISVLPGAVLTAASTFSIMGEFLMLAPSNRADVASQVKKWTRERFGLGGDATILVTELESATPGFPALHTVVAFWTAERKHYHFRIFKPLENVQADDLPPSWSRHPLPFTPVITCHFFYP